MKSVSRFLAAIAVCGGLLMVLLSLTPAKSVTIDTVTVAPMTIDGVIQPDVSMSNADPVPQEFDVLETLTDRCSGDVVVKVPFSSANSLDDDDIILARSESMCRLVREQTHRGVCQQNPNQNSAFTGAIPYSSIRNSERRFRWYCGRTPERSRCRQGTQRVRFRIGPNRLFETQCLR